MRSSMVRTALKHRQGRSGINCVAVVLPNLRAVLGSITPL